MIKTFYNVKKSTIYLFIFLLLALFNHSSKSPISSFISSLFDAIPTGIAVLCRLCTKSTKRKKNLLHFENKHKNFFMIITFTFTIYLFVCMVCIYAYFTLTLVIVHSLSFSSSYLFICLPCSLHLLSVLFLWRLRLLWCSAQHHASLGWSSWFIPAGPIWHKRSSKRINDPVANNRTPFYRLSCRGYRLIWSRTRLRLTVTKRD